MNSILPALAVWKIRYGSDTWHDCVTSS